MKKIKIGIAGCLGRMGADLVKEAINNSLTEFVGGFEHPEHKEIDKSIGEILNIKTDCVLTSNAKEIFQKADVIIDFTTPDSTMTNLEIASEFKTPMVIGTTGLNEKFYDLIKSVSLKAPIFYSENMSIGINILINLIPQISKVLKSNEYDTEIFERHHRYKVDAPSGTALALGREVAKGRGEILEDKKVFDRTSFKEKRETGDIGFSVVRAGEISGEHKVSFISDNDEIEFSHKAKNRSIFVIGAIKASIWLAGQKPGIYSMKNILNY